MLWVHESAVSPPTHEHSPYIQTMMNFVWIIYDKDGCYMVLFCPSVYICELTFYWKKKGLSLLTIYFMSYRNQYKLMDLKKKSVVKCRV